MVLSKGLSPSSETEPQGNYQEQKALHLVGIA